MTSDHVYQLVFKTLKEISLNEYENEEKELQPYLKDEIFKAVEKTFPGVYDVRMSIGGKEKESPRVDLLGTNFWPDIEVSSTEGEPILAVEVKLAKQKSFAASISTTIGQCMIYKLKYPHVLGFIKNQKKTYYRNDEYDQEFERMLNRLKLPLIIRPWKGSGVLSFNPIG